jgi:hypothetical protein
VNIKEMSISQILQLRVSLERELVDRTIESKEKTHDRNMAIMQSLAGRMSQPEPSSQQTIAAKSESEIQARAERMLAATSNQRVVI